MAKLGFIQHPWTNQRGDSISAALVIKSIESNAISGSGLYYEIYHYRVVCQLLLLLDSLNVTDRLILTQEATRRGFKLDEFSISESCKSYSYKLREIRNEEF